MGGIERPLLRLIEQHAWRRVGLRLRHWILQAATRQLNQYRQACAEHSRVPRAAAVRRDIYIGANSQQAAKVKAQFVQRDYRGFAPEALMVGSVNEVADLMGGFCASGFIPMSLFVICTMIKGMRWPR